MSHVSQTARISSTGVASTALISQFTHHQVDYTLLHNLSEQQQLDDDNDDDT